MPDGSKGDQGTMTSASDTHGQQPRAVDNSRTGDTMTAEGLEISPLDVDVVVTTSHEPRDEYRAYRRVHAEVRILAEGPDEGETIGTLKGWIARDDAPEPIADVGDGISMEAGHLAETAGEVLAGRHASTSDTVVMVDRVKFTEARWLRGNLVGMIVENLVDVLQLDTRTTIAVIDPESLAHPGDLSDLAEEQAINLPVLQSTCRAAGFTQWAPDAAFWRGFGALRHGLTVAD